MLDGGSCCVDADGRTNFNRLMFRRQQPYSYAFDLPMLDGERFLSTAAQGARRAGCDPAGVPIPADGYVVREEIGGKRGSIKTAWGGYLQTREDHRSASKLPAARGGLRWLDAGVPLATIQRWLGHANISRTSTYRARPTIVH